MKIKGLCPHPVLLREFISITYQGNMAEGIFDKARGDKFFFFTLCPPFPYEPKSFPYPKQINRKLIVPC